MIAPFLPAFSNSPVPWGTCLPGDQFWAQDLGVWLCVRKVSPLAHNKVRSADVSKIIVKSLHEPIIITKQTYKYVLAAEQLVMKRIL